MGLTYTKKSRFRGRVVAAFGDPFEVADLRESYTAGERAAVRTLTERIRERIRDREPNAAGATRHQRGLVAEHLVSFLPNFRRNRNDPEHCRPVSGG